LNNLEYLLKEFNEERNAKVNFLAAGRPSTIEEYRQTVGYIRGLESAIEITKDLVHRLEHSDDD
jgi:hypothetical protein